MPITPTAKVWMDGKLVGWEDATVHVLTHTLHYGSGVFEGIRAYATPQGPAIFRLREHIERLARSAHLLAIELPFDVEQIVAACVEVVRASGLDECYLRPLVYLGYGEMGLNPLPCPVNVAVACWPWGAYLGDDGATKGVRLKTSSFVRFHHNSLMSLAKASGHYVNSILAGYEARRNGYDEALLLDVHGYVAEGSGENFFIVRDNVVKTPPLNSVLPGITRAAVMKILADASIEVVEQTFPRDAVYIADEAFMTGTAAEVTPVRELDDRTIGSGVPGPVTIKVQEVFRNALHGRDPRYREWLHYV